ncbi:carbohydrate-binding protein [Enorma massiliensis]|uniref:carbohydrate-binding protein n=1 Tax=Enorma massiliensis TaxID=1472761 RepID=UPI0023F08168|nr:carbohydrate-binding protein [Enorma massiliensis]
MLYGIMVGDRPAIVGEGEGGKPVVESAKPEVPEGYEAVDSWADNGTELRQSWALQPVEGSAAEAAVALAKMQATELSDGDAVKVPALYDEWSGDGVEYKKVDRRRFQGTLVKCLQDHTSQPDWAPNAAPSLWAVILPGQDGSGVTVGIWEQPGPENAYQLGDQVIHNGHLWESDFDGDNVWEPGQVGSHWVDKGEWDGGTSLPAAE